MTRTWNPWPWLQPLLKNCNSPFEGWLGLAMIKRGQAGSNDLGKAGGPRDGRVVLRSENFKRSVDGWLTALPSYVPSISNDYFFPSCSPGNDHEETLQPTTTSHYPAYKQQSLRFPQRVSHRTLNSQQCQALFLLSSFSELRKFHLTRIRWQYVWRIEQTVNALPFFFSKIDLCRALLYHFVFSASVRLIVIILQ